MSVPKLSKCTSAPHASIAGVTQHVLLSGPNATATNGHLLVTVPHGLECANIAPTLIPADVWAMMEKAKRPPTLEADAVMLDNGVRVPLGERPSAAAYPDRAKVEPAGPPTATIRLDVRLLMLIAQAIRSNVGSKDPPVVMLELHGEDKPIRVSSDYADGSALLMPVGKRKS